MQYLRSDKELRQRQAVGWQPQANQSGPWGNGGGEQTETTWQCFCSPHSPLENIFINQSFYHFIFSFQKSVCLKWECVSTVCDHNTFFASCMLCCCCENDFWIWNENNKNAGWNRNDIKNVLKIVVFIFFPFQSNLMTLEWQLITVFCLKQMICGKWHTFLAKVFYTNNIFINTQLFNYHIYVYIL